LPHASSVNEAAYAAHPGGHRFMPDEEELIRGICFEFAISAVLLSIWNAFRRLSPLDRFSPLGLQIIGFLLTAAPFTHGFPSENFKILVWIFFWFLLSVSYAGHLTFSPDTSSRILAFVLFVESASLLTDVFLDYAGSCYWYYGHFVWNP
jgi:hypothetical protein